MHLFACVSVPGASILQPEQQHSPLLQVHLDTLPCAPCKTIPFAGHTTHRHAHAAPHTEVAVWTNNTLRHAQVMVKCCEAVVWVLPEWQANL